MTLNVLADIFFKGTNVRCHHVYALLSWLFKNNNGDIGWSAVELVMIPTTTLWHLIGRGSVSAGGPVGVRQHGSGGTTPYRQPLTLRHQAPCYTSYLPVGNVFKMTTMSATLWPAIMVPFLCEPTWRTSSNCCKQITVTSLKQVIFFFLNS